MGLAVGTEQRPGCGNGLFFGFVAFMFTMLILFLPFLAMIAVISSFDLGVAAYGFAGVIW